VRISSGIIAGAKGGTGGVIMTRRALKNLVSAWWFTPAVGLLMFALKLALPNTTLDTLGSNLLYPETDWVGAVSVKLADVPGYPPASNDLEIILMTHGFKESTRVTVLRTLSDGRKVVVLAGATAASLTLENPQARTSGEPLFDVDVPPATLVATSVLAPRGTNRSHYSMITPRVTKQVTDSGDLIVLTRNDVRNTRIAYILILVALALVAVFMPRFSTLVHPGDG
jgi:hypothetical protein